MQTLSLSECTKQNKPTYPSKPLAELFLRVVVVCHVEDEDPVILCVKAVRTEVADIAAGAYPVRIENGHQNCLVTANQGFDLIK